MAWIADADAWISLATLTTLEIVLGIDNIVFISILVGRLPAAQRARGRTFGLALALGTRILLLFSLTAIMRLTKPLFAVAAVEISGRDLILAGGGLFLLWKSVHEIHNALEGPAGTRESAMPATFAATLVQIALIDVVFSFDSVITAVGLADHIGVMVTAVVIAVVVMMFAAGAIGDFVDRHPTVKMLALAFLILIGVALIAEGFDVHIPKGYIYFAMAFSIAVEMLNLRARTAAARRAAELPEEPVHLRKRLEE
jgi:predicted tellurium resistance membrane protein TerC